MARGLRLLSSQEMIMNNFRNDSAQIPLGNTLSKLGQGIPGIADFSAGTYPACSIHGAMNRVSPAQMWRCLQCNIGIEYDD